MKSDDNGVSTATLTADEIVLHAPTTSVYGDIRAGVSAVLNTTTAVNGSGGGNRTFDTSFTGASATGFTGTDATDGGYGFFAATIVSGHWYRVSIALVISNSTIRYLITSTSTNFATGTVQTIVEDPAHDVGVMTYEFQATGDAAYVGIGSNRASGTMLLAVSDFSIVELGSALRTSGGNVGLGGLAARSTTQGSNRFDLYDGTAPVGTLANGISLYSTSGELRVMDAAGNATLLSPHDRLTNEWIFDSIGTSTGKGLRIEVERLLRFISDYFSLDAVHEFSITTAKEIK